MNIVINKIGSAGSVYLVPKLDIPISLAMNQFLIRPNEKVYSKFLYYLLKGIEDKIKGMAHGAVTKTITKNEIKSIKVKIPSKKIQEKILSELENEEKLIENNQKIQELYKIKIKTKIKELWLN